MILQKVINILTQMPQKSQKLVMAQVDFNSQTPVEVYNKVISTMLSVCKNAQQREILQVFAEMRVTDEDVLEAFQSNGAQNLAPMTFDDTQIEFIRESVYRNRDGEFRLIPRGVCSADAMPLEGLKADEDIIAARLTSVRTTPSGANEEFNGLKELRKQPYDGPFDGVYRTLAPNLKRIEIISSFNSEDPYGFFTRGDQMYRNVCSQMTRVNSELVNETSLKRAMFLLYLVSGANVEDWFTLYKLIHFMVRVPNSATGYILYLNDFDAGGNGKSKLVSVLQRMFGESFTAFSPQQLRFTISLMGKRLVSISEYEDNEASKPLQGLLKSMTGRDNFQYEGKGTNPIVAETYQNFVISSNRYINFEDSGIKRRLQNFHCSNLLHLLLNRYCRTTDYLDKLFGSVYGSEALNIQREMAHSLLDFIIKDNNTYSIPIRPQNIVLGSLKNPILRALFAPRLQFEGFIRSTPSDGSAIDIFRLAPDAKPEQFNYAASVIQSWLSDVTFTVARDSTTMSCNIPENVLVRRLKERLSELDETSNQLRAKNKVSLQLGSILGGRFDAKKLFDEFLGDAVRKYNVPVTVNDFAMEVGQ